MALGTAVAGLSVGVAPIAAAVQLHPGGPVKWDGCGIVGSSWKLLQVYARRKATAAGHYFAGGVAYLRCGNADFGLRHILKRHLDDWEAQAALASEPWRDLADLAMKSGLSDSDAVTYTQANDAFCFQRVLYFARKSDGKVFGEINTATVVGATTLNIVTAFPGTCSADRVQS
jgi:hypothetical protein